MKQEEKQLLLKDLSARLPYGVIVEYGVKYGGRDLGEKKGKLTGRMLDSYFYNITVGLSQVYSIKPYLRPMSSMTEEEHTYWDYISSDSGWGITEGLISECVDWLNAHHFDYRGLIEKGLAIKAPEGMYKKGE